MKSINFITFHLFIFLLDRLTHCKVVPKTMWVISVVFLGRLKKLVLGDIL